MKNISTKELMALPNWPEFLKVVEEAMEKTKGEIGAKEIFLDDRGDRFIIVADGVDLMEIGSEQIEKI